MKKIIILLMILLMAGGCMGTVTCSLCHEEKKGRTYTVTLEGKSEKIVLCDDCFEEIKPWYEGIGAKIE